MVDAPTEPREVLVEASKKKGEEADGGEVDREREREGQGQWTGKTRGRGYVGYRQVTFFGGGVNKYSYSYYSI